MKIKLLITIDQTAIFVKTKVFVDLGLGVETDIKPPNHKSCFPQFFPRNFLSLSSRKRKQTFYWSKTGFFLVLDQWKVCFLFHLLKLRKIRWKIGRNKICGLVVWCHEQDNILNQSFQVTLNMYQLLLYILSI